MFRIDIGFVGVKRTERIGGVHTGTPAVVRNDIDSPAECVTAQFDRYDTFVHLHTLARPTGILFSPKAELIPSIGTPSMKISHADRKSRSK